jgi:VWFA-related protein
MRRVVVVVLCACVGESVAPLHGQQTPTFRSGVTLIAVDATVLDRDGKPVPGLTAADFEVTLNGHLQPVRALTYEQVAARTPAVAAAPPPAVPHRETTNAVPAAEPPVFVILVDDLSMAPSRGKNMFFAADRFVAGLPASAIVGFTTSSSTSTVNPTLDRASVQAALRAAVGEFIDPRPLPPDVNVGLVEAVEIVNGDDSLLKEVIGRECFQGKIPTPQQIAASTCADDVAKKARQQGALAKQTAARQIQAYVNVIHAMRPASGLKHLVLLSDGLAVPSREGLDLEPIARAAAEAGVQLSILVGEPDPSMADSSAGATAVRRDDDRAVMSGVQTVAEMTGGNFYRVIGTPDPFFNRVAVASSAIYHLGVEAPADSVPGRDFVLAARVTRPGLTVHANRHAIAPSPAVVVPIDDQLRASVAKGEPHYAVPIRVATALRRAESAGVLDLGVSVEVPATVNGPLNVMFGLVDAAGTLRTGRKTVERPTDGTSYRLSLSLPVAPGTYRLRFAVADSSDNVGSVDTGVTAQLNQVGPFQTSDLLTSWSGADGKPQFLALEEVPSAAVGLRTFLELYPPADAPIPPDVGVRVSLLTNDRTPAIEEHDVVPAATNGILHANAEFALDKLAPGTYLLRATVLVAGKAVGTVSTTIRKPGR